MFVNIQILIKLSTVANGARIQSVRRNYRLRFKLVTANTRAKDKYVKAGMINTYFSWLGVLIIGLTETVSAR